MDDVSDGWFGLNGPAIYVSLDEAWKYARLYNGPAAHFDYTVYEYTDTYGIWYNYVDPKDGDPGWYIHGERALNAELTEARAWLVNLRKGFPNMRYRILPFTQASAKTAVATKPSVAQQPWPLTEAWLARLLFETDPTVLSVLCTVADGGSLCVSNEELFERAWLRNEGKRRMWAETVAAKVFARKRAIDEKK